VSARRLWGIVLLLALLTPLGLWLPHHLGAGDAWGEWGPDDVGDQVGFVPRGLARMAGLWRAPAPDYAPLGWEDRPLAHQGIAYIVSALVGLTITGAVIWVLAWLLIRRAKTDAA